MAYASKKFKTKIQQNPGAENLQDGKPSGLKNMEKKSLYGVISEQKEKIKMRVI